MQKRHSTWPNMLKERMCKHLIAKREFIFWRKRTADRHSSCCIRSSGSAQKRSLLLLCQGFLIMTTQPAWIILYAWLHSEEKKESPTLAWPLQGASQGAYKWGWLFRKYLRKKNPCRKFFANNYPCWKILLMKFLRKIPAEKILAKKYANNCHCRKVLPMKSLQKKSLRKKSLHKWGWLFKIFFHNLSSKNSISGQCFLGICDCNKG